MIRPMRIVIARRADPQACDLKSIGASIREVRDADYVIAIAHSPDGGHKVLKAREGEEKVEVILHP